MTTITKKPAPKLTTHKTPVKKKKAAPIMMTGHKDFISRHEKIASRIPRHIFWDYMKKNGLLQFSIQIE